MVQWFPERRGLLGGAAVAGFGAGALVAGPLATLLLAARGAFATLVLLGPAYLVLAAAAAWFLQAPPAHGCQPAGIPARSAAARAYGARAALATWQWSGLWGLLFPNVAAGSALLAHAAGMAQEVVGMDARLGAAFVGLLALANAFGRLLWPGLSDVFGRRAVFLLQAAALLPLTETASPVALALLGMLVLLCYGGGFGTVAAWAADYFGPRRVGVIYGLLMTACGAGGVVRPLLLAVVREWSGGYGAALVLLAGAMLLGAAVALVLRPPPPSSSDGLAVSNHGVGGPGGAARGHQAPAVAPRQARSWAVAGVPGGGDSALISARADPATTGGWLVERDGRGPLFQEEDQPA